MIPEIWKVDQFNQGPQAGPDAAYQACDCKAFAHAELTQASMLRSR